MDGAKRIPENTKSKCGGVGRVVAVALDENVNVVKRERRDEVGEEPRTEVLQGNPLARQNHLEE